MSSVYPRKTKVVDTPEPPLDVPIDANIPDNYVAHTLKTQKPLPPITWSNWWKELNWLSFTILTVTPTVGIVGAMFTKLRWETFLFAVFYYYVTGLGKFSLLSF
jgi:stearoyl-CoA desaturase (delta-9 desaturase)